jgi:hypothetical protein
VPILSYLLSALVGLVLVTTGVIKLREGRRSLGETIETFRVVPPSMARLTVAVLPPIELAIGICLLFGMEGPWSLAAAARQSGCAAVLRDHHVLSLRISELPEVDLCVLRLLDKI